MNIPGRRERDERRKFKDLGSLQRMGEALGFHDDSVEDAEVIDDPRVSVQGGGNPPPRRTRLR